MAGFSMLSYDLDGIPTTLMSEEECKRAVERGRILADTPVTVYFDDGRAVRQRAGEADLFAGCFAEPELAAEAPAIPVSTPEPEPEKKADKKEAKGGPWEIKAAAPMAPAAVEVAESPTEPEPQPVESTVDYTPVPADHSLRNLLLAAAGALTLGYCVFSPSQKQADATGAFGDNVVVGAEPTVDAAAAASVTETEQSFYTARFVNVQPEPMVGKSGNLPQITRGEPVTGIVVADKAKAERRWLKLTKGPHTGGYVSVVNLVEEQPPVIDAGQSGTFQLTEDTTLLSGPSSSSSAVSGDDTYLKKGMLVETAGTLDGQWTEIMRKHGGVAYVPASAVTRFESTGNAHPIYIKNECAETLYVGFRYQNQDGWQFKYKWTFGTGFDDYLAYSDGTKVYTTDPNIFYRPVSASTFSMAVRDDKTVLVDGEAQKLKRAVPILDVYGNYTITFCANGTVIP